MNSTRPLAIAVGLIPGGQPAFAQNMSRYRADVFFGGLDAVVAATPAARGVFLRLGRRAGDLSSGLLGGRP
jgi:hypothetical protein